MATRRPGLRPRVKRGFTASFWTARSIITHQMSFAGGDIRFFEFGNDLQPVVMPTQRLADSMAHDDFQQQLITVGVPAVVEDRDPVAILGILEHLEDVTRLAVLPNHHFAQPRLLRRFQHLALRHQPLLLD